MKIAIVGTGIAGLTAGWLLQRGGHEVTLIERLPALGLAAHGESFVDRVSREVEAPAETSEQNSREVEAPAETVAGDRFRQEPRPPNLFRQEPQPPTLRADLPPRLFNENLWPNLWQLYQQLGVEIERVESTKSFGIWNGKTALRMGRNWFRRPVLARAMGLLSRDSRNIASGIVRLENGASKHLRDGSLGEMDFDSYLLEKKYISHENSKCDWNPFINQFLLPSLSSTVCTCSHQSVRRYPAATILEAVCKLIEGEQLYRVRAGVAEVTKRLSGPITDIRLNALMQDAARTDTGVRIQLQNAPPLDVDHLIIATQANSALKILPQLTAVERAMLESFEYEDSEIVLHRDPALMPKSRRHWSLFNLLSDPGADDSMCTVWMNRFHTEWETQQPVFQTIRPLRMPAAETVICHRRLQRPVVNQKSLTGLERLRRLHSEPNRRIWFVGSYAAAGVPLLESGVVSSQNVVEKLTVLGHSTV